MNFYTIEEFFKHNDKLLWERATSTLQFKIKYIVTNPIWPSDVRSKKIDDWLSIYCPNRASRIVNDIICFENKNDVLLYILNWSGHEI
jgi:hypothetical protein